MKFFGFLVLSAVYGALASFIWFQIALSCGLGPDSPVSCNEKADRNAAFFAVAAIAIYGVAAFLYWRRPRSKVR